MNIKSSLSLIVAILLDSQRAESQSNFQPCPSSPGVQVEPVIASHPLNPNIILGTAFVYSSTDNGMLFLTTNAGTTWLCNDPPIPPPILVLYSPRPVIDKNGVMIIAYFDWLSGGMSAMYSTNNGESWSLRQISSHTSDDSPFIATDDVPSSPYYGRTYVVSSRFGTPTGMAVSYTTDSGSSWSTPQLISQVPRAPGADVAVDPQGDAYLIWARGISAQYYGLGKSTDGGVTWQVTDSVFDGNGIGTILPEKQNIRVRSSPRIAIDKSGGPHRGSLYIVTHEKNIVPAGSDPDIVLHRSTDGGETWTHRRVNQDSLENGKIQYFPAVAVDDGGGVNVVYYDDRTTTSDSASVFLSRSTDGGDTWLDIEIADRHFRPGPNGASGRGDYTGINAAGERIWPYWTDNRTGTYRIWAVDRSITDIADNQSYAPMAYALYQNYPNPFNPGTKIVYRVASRELVSLKIFNLLGQEVATLVDEVKQPGRHEVIWDASGLPSGVYFYRLHAEEFVSTKKLLLLK